MKRESYNEMKKRHRAEVNALPLAFAFSKEQYREKLAARIPITTNSAAAWPPGASQRRLNGSKA